MTYNIAVLKGDGIGPEVIDQTIAVLKKLETKSDVKFQFTEALIGGSAIDATGDPLPQETLDICKSSHSVLLGAVGGTKWDNMPVDKRPEKGLLRIREGLGLYANLRPAVLYDALDSACPIKESFRTGGIDIMVVRELTGGIYFGERGRTDTDAYDVERYSVTEIERIAKTAFEIAMKRGKKVVSVDKANVLESSRLWRSVVDKVALSYPDVELSYMFVDNASMQLVKDPSSIDVLLTNNIFGDILSDEASMITGSIGILPSASLSDTSLGMYEPIHGSAPDIAGKNIANPIATILSASMMLRYSLNLPTEADIIENAVMNTLNDGWRTKDISMGCDEDKILTCSDMGKIICENI